MNCKMNYAAINMEVLIFHNRDTKVLLNPSYVTDHYMHGLHSDPLQY